MSKIYLNEVEKMLYKKLYFKLFGILSDVIELLENGNVWEAKQLLIKTQQEAEEFYIDNADDAEGST